MESKQTMKSLNIFFFLPYWPERTKSKPKIDCEIIIISTTLCDVYNVAILIFLQNFVSYTRTQFLNFFLSFIFFFFLYSRFLKTFFNKPFTVIYRWTRDFSYFLYLFIILHKGQYVANPPPPISKSKIIIEAFTVAYRWTREFL